jgi:hypothetical protein
LSVEPDQGAYFAITAAGGGYAIPITAAGTYSVSFYGGELASIETREVVIDADSLLLDLQYAESLDDTDGDGTPDALDLDDDGDGMLDEFELANQSDPLDKTDAALDADKDGLTNLAEQNAGTAPRYSGSDNDGYLDGEDIDPLDWMNPIPMEALPSRGGWRAILR